MLECTNCGATLKPGDSRCPSCGLATPAQRAQRVCINCGSPAAQGARTCIMCGHEIDTLPRRAMTFSHSWPGILIGLVVVLSLVYWFFQVDQLPVVAEITDTPTPRPTTTFVPPTMTATGTPTLSPTPSATLTPTPDDPIPTPAPVVHAVRAGDSLLIIANLYGTTVDALTAANNITENSILSIGQNLIIPIAPVGGVGTAPAAAATPTEPPPQGEIITYTIQSGDIVSQISVDYDVSISDIRAANPGVNLDFLSVGQEIQIPLNPPTATPTPAPTPTPTFTPGPPFPRPRLLLPADGALIDGENSAVLLSWTASELLPADTYYVVLLTDEAGEITTYWTQATSYRLPANLHPSTLTTYAWYVVVMEEIGVDQNNIFYGNELSLPSETHTFSWR